MSERTDRVDELLREELSSILARDVADPGIGFATITRVETAADLRHARVWVSVIGQPDERRETLKALERAMPFARRRLGERIRLRRIPELQVRLDDSVERGTRVLRILSELEAGQDPAELPAVGESLPTPGRAVPDPEADPPGSDDDAADGAPGRVGPPRRSVPQRRRGAHPPAGRVRRTGRRTR
jgi:ribosome-binding factor A